jgi:hypothetical protein
MRNPILILREKASALLSTTDPTPTKGYTTKKEKWREYPLELTEHHSHDRVTTQASYGEIRVCYCYDCGRHYRNLESRITRKE